MTGPVVLVVDDDAALRRVLGIQLRAHGWSPVLARDGDEAVELANRVGPDVIVLDLGLPDLDGVDVIRRLRETMITPIVVLSARQGGGDKVLALDAGADDYVTKPFGVEELLARLRAAVRRATPADDREGAVVRAGALAIDLAAKRVHRGAVEVKLTPTEWSMLEVLVRHRGEVVSGPDLLREVWGPSYRTESNYLRVYAAQLRRKLEEDPAHPVHLVTRPGRGYLFEA
ncbi:response regulator [Actinotalea sp. K2]|uniref:response regulator n=1 Tax=Actinotalea sp. K2 TaxID=2939438 RepID=UPI0020176497|nr:response regulator transcription factor [Actinotalea sp. K2]MCL3861085.1 response regulator transcription factor [Actinotalea sp. K2]